MTQDEILKKVQLLADKVMMLRDENRQLKEDNSRLSRELAEAQSRADDIAGQQSANTANLLLMQQKEELMQAAHEDLQTNYDRARAEVEAQGRIMKEYELRLHEAEAGVGRVSMELSSKAHAIDEKNNIIRALEDKLNTQENHWAAVLREKDEAILRFTEELKSAVQKLESLRTEREDITTQLDDLITHVDGQIEQLKTDANG